MKIKRIEVKNFKAISDNDIDFNGMSAIITAGNNKGKSSLLKGLIDRFRGEKPELIVKDVKCNWEPIGKAEVIYTAAACSGLGLVVGYIDIEDK